MNIRIKQRDITDCGAACLASVAAFYKLKLPVSIIREWAGTDKGGTNAYGIVKAAEKLGMNAKGVSAAPKELSKIPLPAIAHVIINKKLYHYVVIYKSTSNYVKIMDPATGKMKKQKLQSFQEEWTGILIILSPSANFKPGKQKVSNIKHFCSLLDPHRQILIQALVGAAIFTLLGLSTSIYIQKITDYVLINGNKNLLNLLSISMIIILLFQIFIGSMQNIFVTRTGQQIDGKLILGYYKHLLKLPQQFFDNRQTGEIVSRINDAVKIRAFFNDTVITFVVDLFIVMFAFLLMFIYNWKLALILSAMIPVFIVIYIITNYLNKKRERKIMVKAADLESQLVESINSAKTIKQYNLEYHSNLKTEIRFVDLLNSTYKSSLNAIFSNNSTIFFSKLFTIILLWSGSFFVLRREITPGELISFYALMEYFTGPVLGIINMNKIYQNALIAADRLFEIMDLKGEPHGDLIDAKKAEKGDINFRNVTFGYGTRTEVFRNFNLTIKKGKITAIIGESGSGKTTIASLLNKLYPLNYGAIYIGNNNIEYFSNESLRQIIGIVPQNIDLFTGTFIENIAAGDIDPDMSRIITICKQLGMTELIEKLPNGFATFIGENGATLSGGQQQRLAIARALYRCPDILILDEATSSLDSIAEQHVQQIIKQFKKEEKTIIIITHRLTSLMFSDIIVVLENGELKEQGSHSELYKKHGKYYQLWNKQMPGV